MKITFEVEVDQDKICQWYEGNDLGWGNHQPIRCLADEAISAWEYEGLVTNAIVVDEKSDPIPYTLPDNVHRLERGEIVDDMYLGVDLVASGYEATCPKCDEIVLFIEVPDDDEVARCPECGTLFTTDLPEHAYG